VGEVWLMTGQVAALAFILSVGVAVIIYVIRTVLRRFLRKSGDS
jgi:uncharacterized protein HemY